MLLRLMVFQSWCLWTSLQGTIAYESSLWMLSFLAFPVCSWWWLDVGGSCKDISISWLFILWAPWIYLIWKPVLKSTSQKVDGIKDWIAYTCHNYRNLSSYAKTHACKDCCMLMNLYTPTNLSLSLRELHLEFEAHFASYGNPRCCIAGK